MNIKLKYIVISMLFMTLLVEAQNSVGKKADNNFNNYAYANAIDSYEDLIKKGHTSEQIYKNLGNANYLNAKYVEAVEWYEKLFKLKDANIEPEYMYRFAQSLKSIKKYKASDKWMQKFETIKSEDIRSIKYRNNKDYLREIAEQSGRYEIKNIAVNSSASDFSPSFYADELVFSTARDTGIASRSLHAWNKKPFLNLYKASVSESGELNSASKLSKSLNKKTHESSIVFTKDGKTVYFTRNNSKKGNFSRDRKGVSRLKIYKATLEGNEWKNIKELPFNSDEYSVSHPALSADERKLYFASDMPGTYGASDIYMVTINEEGSYGTPKNLGNTINTEARETFPYVTASSILYFASDGHPGLGGLDIFATKLNYDSPMIVNVGEPVNSEQDDFSFIINEANKKGYFASNREGGKGSDDIYSFLETKPLNLDCSTSINGIVKDFETGETIAGAKVTVMDNNVMISELVSDEKGAFVINSSCKEDNYKITASKEGYEVGNTSFASNNISLVVEVLLPKHMEKVPLGTDLTEYLNLEPIYFNLDKSYIRADARKTIEKVIAYMKANPTVKIDIRSHTDSRATNGYNNQLSNRRAKETMAYLISKGIASSRLTGEGYGESQLTNECKDDVLCSEDKHQMNRRSEFIIVK